jgi:hypothetical protein
MKTIFVLLVCFTSNSISQNIRSNPDGQIGILSLHFTPMVSNYKAEHFDTQSEKYAETEASGKFDFRLLAKFPTSEVLTISLFYESFNQDYNYKQTVTPVFTETGEGSTSRYGATISLYFVK